MATAATIATNNYLTMLNLLSDEMKLAIVNGLTKSLTVKPKPSKLESLFGAWKDSSSADEIIANIYASRLTGTRQIESFD